MSVCLPVNQARRASMQFARCVGGETVKYASLQGLGSYSVQKLAGDAIGSKTVTFDGVNAGSEIRVYLPDGSEAAGIESCAADQVLIWNAYPTGNPNNGVTIRIVHPAYEIQEFVFTSAAGAQVLPIQQMPDRWYSNP